VARAAGSFKPEVRLALPAIRRELSVSDPIQRTPYDRIGGEAGVRRLTRRFYALMDSLPEAATCRAIHPPSLESSEQKLFEYLTGWLGGPPLFVERRGPPMLRWRHLHAPIAGPEIEGWLACFRQAWAETVADQALGALVLPQVEGLARHMRNRAEG
jgi:hemoglobin